MKPNAKIQDSEKFRDWINNNLFSDATSLTRILCLLELCGGIEPSEGEFTEGSLIRVLEHDPDPIVRHEAAFTLYKSAVICGMPMIVLAAQKPTKASSFLS